MARIFATAHGEGVEAPLIVAAARMLPKERTSFAGYNGGSDPGEAWRESALRQADRRGHAPAQ